MSDLPELAIRGEENWPGELDEFVCHQNGVSFHAEMMDATTLWMCVTFTNGEQMHLNASVAPGRRKRLRFTIQEEPKAGTYIDIDQKRKDEKFDALQDEWLHRGTDA